MKEKSKNYQFLFRCDFNKYNIQILKRIASLKTESEALQDPLTEHEESEDLQDFLLLKPKATRMDVDVDSENEPDSSEE